MLKELSIVLCSCEVYLYVHVCTNKHPCVLTHSITVQQQHSMSISCALKSHIEGMNPIAVHFVLKDRKSIKREIAELFQV